MCPHVRVHLQPRPGDVLGHEPRGGEWHDLVLAAGEDEGGGADLAQPVGHERAGVQRPAQLGQEPLRRGGNRLEAGSRGERSRRRGVAGLATGAHLERHPPEELGPLTSLAQVDPLLHTRRHPGAPGRLGRRRGQHQARHDRRVVHGEPQRDPAAAGLGLDRDPPIRGAGRGDGHRDRGGADPWMEECVRIRRVVRDGAADHDHGTGRSPPLPAPGEEGLGAGQEPQPGLHAAHDEERDAGAAGQDQPLDSAAGHRQRLDHRLCARRPGLLRHRSILAC